MNPLEELLKPANKVFERWSKFFDQVDTDIATLERASDQLNTLEDSIHSQKRNINQMMSQLAKLGKTWRK